MCAGYSQAIVVCRSFQANDACMFSGYWCVYDIVRLLVCAGYSQATDTCVLTV